MHQPKTLKIVALETGHLSKTAISGGDVLLEKMYPHIKIPLDLTIVIPQFQAKHWQKHKKVKVKKLRSNYFDKFENNFAFFASYLIRSYKSYSAIKNRQFEITYSSANVLPDVLPLFFYKLARPNTHWIGRIHHISPPTTKREGNALINTIAFLIQKIVLKMLKKTDSLIVLNENLKHQLENLGFEKSKLTIIGGGVDIQKIKRAKKTQPLFDAIFVGRGHRTKGILDLVQIWKNVTKYFPESKLAVVGEIRPNILSKLKAQIYQNDLQNNIKIFGYVKDSKLYGLLKSSKLFLFTDYEAGFSLAAAEAMAAGIPVVAYQNPIFGNIYKTGFYLVEKSKLKEFSRTILKLLKDKKTYKRLAKAAQKQSEEFNWPITSKKFERVLKPLQTKHFF